VWKDIWLAQMIRLESFAFMERLIHGDTLDREAGTLYNLMRNRDNRRETESGERNENLNQLIQSCGIDDAALTKRLVVLIEAVRSRSTPRFRYACELSIRPHIVTWKEFRSLQALWTPKRRPSELSKWITKHANTRAVSVDDVEAELFSTLIMARQESLSRAADTHTVQEHDTSIEEAVQLLELMEQFLIEKRRFTAEKFNLLYGQVLNWFHFRTNTKDKDLRDLEAVCVEKLLNLASGPDCSTLSETINPEQWPPPTVQEGADEKKDFQRKCEAIIFPKAAEEALALLRRSDGVRSLYEPGKFNGIKKSLFPPPSPLWEGDLRQQLLKLIDEGLEQPTIYANIWDLLNLLVQTLEKGTDFVARDDAKKRLLDNEFIGAVWRVVISKEMQYRMQIVPLRYRASLLKLGIPESLLPLTPSLEKREVDMAASQKLQAQPESESIEQ